MGHVKQILKDASSLNSAGDPDPNTFSVPPRNLREFRLGWLPRSNWFRQKYEQEAQITVISVDKDGSPTHGGQDPFEQSSTSFPCLTVISPEGFFFAVANSDGKLDIRRAVTGEKHGKVLHCRHIPDNHQVVWMYFLDESCLVAEYKCGSIHNHRLEDSSHEDPDTVHSLSSIHSSSNIFSTCSLDRSTILRLTKLGNSDQGGRESARAGDQYDGLLVYPGEPLSAYTIDCRSWNNPPFALPSPNVSEECLLDPGSLAISRNNEYAAAVLIDRDGSQHDSRRHVHLWSIPGRRYVGCRELRGPRWESWIPANYFDIIAFSLGSAVTTHNRLNLTSLLMCIIPMMYVCGKIVDHGSHFLQKTVYSLWLMGAKSHHHLVPRVQSLLCVTYLTVTDNPGSFYITST